MTKFEEGFLDYILMKYGREPFDYLKEVSDYRYSIGASRTETTFLIPEYITSIISGSQVLTTEAFKHFGRMKNERPNTV